jgi:P pilus assembly chaperone PapD
MNMLVWWFALMLLAWALAAYVLYGTNIVVSAEDDEEAATDLENDVESDRER